MINEAANHVNPKWIQVTWSGIAGMDWSITGGDEPVYYGLEWDQGKNEWINVTDVSMGLITSFNVTTATPLPSGVPVRFRTFAKNGVGFGVYSEILEIISDKVPQFMNKPVVDYSSNHINPRWILVTWLSLNLADNTQTGGDDIIYYGL